MIDILIGAIIGIACAVLYNSYFKKEHLKEEFRNISNEILAQQADSIAKKATDTVETTNKAIINPLETQLKEIKEYVEGVEKERKQDKGSITTELENLSKVLSGELKSTTLPMQPIETYKVILKGLGSQTDKDLSFLSRKEYLDHQYTV